MTIPHVSDRDRPRRATDWLNAYPASEAILYAENANDLGAPSPLDQRVAEAHVESTDAAPPQYEYSRPFTVGGVPATLPYKLLCPFDSPAEVCITSVAFAGPTLFVLISDADSLSLPSDTASLGNYQWSIVVVSNVLTTIPMQENWYPLAQQTPLCVYVGGNGSGTKSAWVNVQFRRKLTPAGVPWLGG